MSGASRSAAEPPPITVAHALGRSGSYPGDPPVTVCETHTAMVFLAGDRAYKIKKPVRMKFLDFSTLEQRRFACLEELRVNRELAPGVCLRLRAVVALAESYVLVDAPHPEAVEYVIEMRRFDETRSMAALVARGALADEHVRAAGRRLAAFHAAATVVRPADHAGDVMRACEGNLGELLAIADDATARRVLSAERFSAAFVVAHRHELAARAAAGHVRDGHGDLRAEHVVFEDPLVIVDRLEFDARLREIDVADDLAFLVMDLERLGAPEAARLLAESYREAGADPGSDELLAFYAAYRALVRAKVALLRAAQLDATEEGAGADARYEATQLLELAERLAWRARGPMVLAVGGPPASGKSTLAAAIARRSGLPVLSSDVQRKRDRGLALTAAAPEAAYTPAARTEVYRELGERARAQLDSNRAVILDATFGDAGLRRTFRDGLGPDRRLVAVECVAPARLRARWARDRASAAGSDAGPDVVARSAASFTDWDELSEEAILSVRSAVDPDLLVDEIADWLDTRAERGCGGERPLCGRLPPDPLAGRAERAARRLKPVP